MATWEVFVTYSIDDTIEVEADTAEDALEIAYGGDIEHNLLPYSNSGGFTTTWDDVNAYDAILVDGDENE